MSSPEATGRHKAPAREQRICTGCGMCCDGTLFRHTGLIPGERGNLPVLIEEVSFSENGREYFRQPCPYFAGNCTIYKLNRPRTCSSYRCQLLKDVADGKVTAREASEVVERAKQVREELMDHFIGLTGNKRRITFRQVLEELGRINDSSGEECPEPVDIEILTARCNILEALLVKHFRSSTDFDNLIMTIGEDIDR